MYPPEILGGILSYVPSTSLPTVLATHRSLPSLVLTYSPGLKVSHLSQYDLPGPDRGKIRKNSDITTQREYFMYLCIHQHPEEATRVIRMLKGPKIKAISLEELKDLNAQLQPSKEDNTAWCKWAAKSGRLEILQVLRELNRHAWTPDMCATAAENGHLKMLKWLRNRKVHGDDICPWNEETCASAAENGHLKVQDFELAVCRCPCAGPFVPGANTIPVNLLVPQPFEDF
jgi:hypothetical protein